jgi:hypothetical protein
LTLLHIIIERDRALIASDSATYTADNGAPGADVLYWPSGAAVAVSKLRPLPHIRCILVGRGNSSVHQFAEARLRYARDFEHAVEILATALPQMLGAAAARGTYRGAPLRHSVCLVGWSEARGRMTVAMFESEHGYRPQAQAAADGGRCALLAPMVPRPEWMFDPTQARDRGDELGRLLQAEREREPRDLQTAAA